MRERERKWTTVEKKILFHIILMKKVRVAHYQSAQIKIWKLSIKKVIKKKG